MTPSHPGYSLVRGQAEPRVPRLARGTPALTDHVCRSQPGRLPTVEGIVVSCVCTRRKIGVRTPAVQRSRHRRARVPIVGQITSDCPPAERNLTARGAQTGQMSALSCICQWLPELTRRSAAYRFVWLIRQDRTTYIPYCTLPTLVARSLHIWHPEIDHHSDLVFFFSIFACHSL